ncbi:MAG: hypothetical protein WCK11_05495 [Candidatus Falkowbacteria bacterium]
MLLDALLDIITFLVNGLINLMPATDFSILANLPLAFIKFAQDLLKLNTIFPVDQLLFIIYFILQYESYYLVFKLTKGFYRMIRG